MFKIKEVYKGKNTFNIYEHDFNYEQLNKIISEMLFSKKALNYIFTSREQNDDSNYIEMARRFIPVEFFCEEEKVLSDWENSKKIIKSLISSNNSFYSFYAEALMTYLNYKFLGQKLTIGVINVNDTVTDVSTGADACMFYDGLVILGEAKFYKNFNSARNKIIEDFSKKSLVSKIKNLYNNSHKTVEIYYKQIGNNNVKEIPYNEFINYNILLSGFILHNAQKKYSYQQIDNIESVDGLGHYSVVFYHLPIESKEELIYLVIRKALEVIINESR